MPGKIKVLKENRIGKDYVVGQVADSAAALTKIINGLGSDDRLIITGNLFKENNPYDIIQLISKAKKNGKNIEVLLTVREASFISAVDEFEQQIDDFGLGFLSLGPSPSVEDIIDAAKRQGDQDSDDVYKETELKNTLEKCSINSDDLPPWVSGSTVSDLKNISNFFKKLPCVLHVEGYVSGRPFNAVSVDMPFDDEQMAYRLSQNKLELTGVETNSPLSGNLSSSRDFMPITLNEGKPERAPHSVLVYRGGTIPQGSRVCSANNVDLSTNVPETLMLACHQDASVMKALPLESQRAGASVRVDTLSAQLQTVNEHLGQSKGIDDQEQAKFLGAVKACQSGREVDQLLQSRCKDISDLVQRKQVYLGILKMVGNELSPAIRQELAAFLKANVTSVSSSQKGHFLGEERKLLGKLRSGGTYSAKTTSMVAALNYLNKDFGSGLGRNAEAVGMFGGGASSSSSSQAAQSSVVVPEKKAQEPKSDNGSDPSSNSSLRNST